jgi:hypothetical protein
MSKREEFTANQLKIEELNSQSDELLEQSYQLEEQNRLLVKGIIEEERLLDGTEWRIKPNGKSVYLEYAGSLRDEIIAKLVELTWHGYHSSFDLGDDVDLRFDDSRVSLYFDNIRVIPSFMRRSGIVIDATQIQGMLAKLKKDALALEMICHQLQLAV